METTKNKKIRPPDFGPASDHNRVCVCAVWQYGRCINCGKTQITKIDENGDVYIEWRYT